MGYDITVTDPNHSWNIQHIYISYNHSKILTEYGFYPRDYNNKTIKEVLIALNTSISKFLENDIQPDYEIRTFSQLCSKQNKTEFELKEVSRINNKYYNDTPNVTLGILMEIRDKLEKDAGLHYIWESD